MNNEILYKIDDFYIGKVNISCKQGNLLIPHDTDFSGLFIKKIKLIEKGAIDDNYNFMRSRNGRIYETVYTVFLRQDDGYLCLHDGNIYKENGDDYCSCLTSFKNYFPKVDFIIPNQLTINEAINYFNIIINDYKGIELYDKNALHSISDYFIGSLDLLTSETIIDNQVFMEKNFINYRLLANNWIGCCGRYTNDGTKDMSYDYLKCLFLKIANRYYSINDFTFYTDMESDDSFCHHLLPYKEYIENFNITAKEDLSIYEANVIYTKLEATKKESKTKTKKFSLKNLFNNIKTN